VTLSVAVPVADKVSERVCPVGAGEYAPKAVPQPVRLTVPIGLSNVADAMAPPPENESGAPGKSRLHNLAKKRIFAWSGPLEAL
jgi:hypothetical protein